MKKIWFNRRVHVQFFNLKKSKNRKTKVECGDMKICMVVVFAKFAFTYKVQYLKHQNYLFPNLEDKYNY